MAPMIEPSAKLPPLPPWFAPEGLFDGASEGAQARLKEDMECVRFSPGEVILRFGDPGADLLYVIEGEARVFRPDGPDAVEVPLATVGPGHTLGEATFVSRGERTATVEATKPLTAWKLSFAALDDAIKEDPSVGVIYQHIAEALAIASRNTADARVASEVRLSLAAKLIVTVIAIQSGTLLATGVMSELMKETSSSTIILLGYLIFITAIGWVYTSQIRLPRAELGVTSEGWRPALKEAALASLAVVAAATAIKAALIAYIPAYQDVPLFDIFDVTADHGRTQVAQLRILALSAVGYTLAGGFQELYARGMLQGQLYEIIRPRFETPWPSIIISNLLFASIHVSWSLSLTLFSFFGGLLWGWLYARQQTLIGVTFSHVVLGLWIGRVLNLFALFRFGPLAFGG